MRCELNVKKCVLFLIYDVCCIGIDAEEVYMMHIAYI